MPMGGFNEGIWQLMPGAEVENESKERDEDALIVVCGPSCGQPTSPSIFLHARKMCNPFFCHESTAPRTMHGLAR
jgi:hypothetical protein